MEVAKVTSKGQITIPISIRRKLDINEGDKVLFIYKAEGVMMVNPETFQGGDAAEVAEPVAAPVKAKKAPKDPPVAAVEPEEETPATETIVTEKVAQEPPKRPVPPPVEEPPKPETEVGGLNLSSLLDDIRSIGSNI